MAAQRVFESRSLLGEVWSQMGQYGLHSAETQSDVERLLRDGAPIDGVRRIDDYDDNLQHWETPLLTACVDQRLAVAEALIRFGAAVDGPNAVRYPDGSGFGHTALHMLVVRRDRIGAERLISAGADVDRQTTLGTTPLWYAANNDDADMVTMLLEAGSRPDLPDFNGSFPTDSAGPITRGILQGAMAELDAESQQAQPLQTSPTAESASGAAEVDAQAAGSHDHPAGIVAIAVGDRHGLALRRDGTVVAWGNAYTTPSGLSGVTAIAAGKSHSLALKNDGTVVAWGHGSHGQAEVPAGLAGVVAIAAGLAHNLALKSDGTVVAWGLNDARQADVPYSLAGVTAIAAGAWHSLALQRDGRVVAWGHPDSDQRHVPQWLIGAVGIAAGYENSSALLPDGTVVDWGTDTNFGRLPADFRNVASIAYGWRNRLALRKDGTVVTDGGEMGGVRVPTGLTDVVAIAGSVIADHRSFLALRRDGTIVPIKHPVVDYRAQEDAEPCVAGRGTPALDVPVELTRLPRAVHETPVTHHPLDTHATRPSGDCEETLDDFEPHNGKTALMHWAAIGDETKVQLLLARGADVEAVDHDGDGVLRYALTSKNPRIFEMLLEGGADPDAGCTSASGRASFSILHAVAEIGWGVGLEALLRHGADVEQTSGAGVSPLMLAAGAGRDSCIDILIRAGADLDAVDDDGDSVLFYAASKGHKTTVARLVDLGADVNPSPGSSGLSPLTVAAHMASPIGRERPSAIPPSNYTRIVLDLVRAGADTTAMYEAGYVLQRQRSGAIEIAPLAHLAQLAGGDNSWSLGYLTEAGRYENQHLLRAEPQKHTPGKAQPSTQSRNGSQTQLGAEKATVEVIGSTQSGFVINPTITVYWNDREIGRVQHGGRLSFDIESDGEVRFKCAFRSAKVRVEVADATKIYLGWDRTWGRLVAARDPSIIPQ